MIYWHSYLLLTNCETWIMTFRVSDQIVTWTAFAILLLRCLFTNTFRKRPLLVTALQILKIKLTEIKTTRYLELTWNISLEKKESMNFLIINNQHQRLTEWHTMQWTQSNETRTTLVKYRVKLNELANFVLYARGIALLVWVIN